jgi:hypothetical protein
MLDAYYAALAEHRRLDALNLTSAEDDEPGAADGERAHQEATIALEEQLQRLYEAYRERVPQVTLSRCPFSGEVCTHSLDYFGLDGLWWHHEAAARPPEEYLPTFFALDGALALSAPLETSPLLVAPGPQAPFVLPRLLQYTQIKAVLSSFAVGHHRAYFIVYYADPMRYDLDRVNEWGATYYRYVDLEGVLRLDSFEDDERDFDLAPWIQEGKLLWIAPDDATLRLQSLLTNCPYLDLPGSHSPVYLQNGESWEGENFDQDWVDANSRPEQTWTDADQQALQRAIGLFDEGEL